MKKVLLDNGVDHRFAAMLERIQEAIQRVQTGEFLQVDEESGYGIS